MRAVMKIKKGALAVVIAFLGVVVLLFSDGVRQGVLNGLALCGNSVIPSLFLFTALSVFAVKSGVLEVFDRCTPISKRVFGLSGSELAVFFVSLVSGYPVGVTLINETYQKGKITERRAQKLSSFCVGAGPAFIISVVGGAVLGSADDGRRIFIATVFSSVVLAVLSRFVEKDKKPSNLPENQKEKAPKISLSDTFVLSVSSASATMLNVSAFVVAFSGILGMLKDFKLPLAVQKYGLSLLEVTSGVANFGRGELCAVAFIVGFGGVSVHLQLLAAGKGFGLTYKRVLLSRILHGALSGVTVFAFDKICPRATETVAIVGQARAGIHGNPLSAAAMLLLAVSVVTFTYKGIKKFKPD